MSELNDAVGKVVMANDREPPSRFGPIPPRTGAPDRFVEIPEAARQWLQGLSLADIKALDESVTIYARLPEDMRSWLKELRSDDVKELRAAIEFARSTRAIGRFAKWLLVTIVATFTATVIAWEKLLLVMRWIGGGR